MSHYTVLVAVPGEVATVEEATHRLEAILEPFNENLEVPRTVWLTPEEVDGYVQHYRDHKDDYWRNIYERVPNESGLGSRYQATGERERSVPDLDEVAEGDLEAFDHWLRQLIAHNESREPEEILRDEDGRWGYETTYNEQGKWDWWTLGGRWSGFWQLKPKVPAHAVEQDPVIRALDEKYNPGRIDPAAGIKHDAPAALLGQPGVFGRDPEANYSGRADIARKRDIDFDAMQTLAGVSAEEAYDRFEAAVGDLPAPKPWREYIAAEFAEIGIDINEEMSSEQREKVDQHMPTLRDAYGQIPWVRALRDAKLDTWFGDDVKEWCVHTGGRAAYVEKARASTVSTAAVLVDGEWSSPDQYYGPFMAMSMDHNREGLNWEQTCWEVIAGLPEDTWLAVVDCHV